MRDRIRAARWLAVILPIVVGCTPSTEFSTRGAELEHELSVNAGEERLDFDASGPSDFSLYNLDSSWWDQHGTTRELSSLGGRVQVLAMIYTNCGHSCPTILVEMKRLESELATTSLAGVGFVLASLDGERDTPQRMRQFASDLRLEESRWTLLGSEDANVRELAAVLGVRYRQESETEISHTNSIFVLTEMGEIVYRLPVGAPHEEALALIRGMVGAAD